MKELNDKHLFCERAYLAGEWCGSADGAQIKVNNPADGRRLGSVPALDAEDTRQAVAAASRAFPAWRNLLPQERAAILLDWYRLVLDNQDDLAALMTLEQGKPLAEAGGEIRYGASFIQWFAEEGKRVYGESIHSHLPDRHLMTIREPVGVTAAITPWNFPAAMITRKAAAAMAAGCPVIVRPAMETPCSALALAVLAERAGVPAGIFSVITGHPEPVVGELCRNPLVRAISFTGSTEIGRLILSQGAATVKKMSMELGGNAPFIVFPDMALEDAVQAALAAKFQTTGQDCLAANRIFVHQDIYESFVERFAATAARLPVGPGLKPDVALGPLIHERALAKTEAYVADALAKGARLLTGGRRHSLGGLFFEPTVLADVTADMAIFREEVFGPVAGIMPFADEPQVIAAANATEYGLAAYLLTRDIGRVLRMIRALEYGMVAVNSVKLTGPPIPFGGVKQSGLGREGSRHGIAEFTELKYVCLGAGDH